MGSLQDALLEAGLVDERKAADARPGKQKSRRSNRAPGSGRQPPRSRQRDEPSDLARAWEARRRAEQAEKAESKRRKMAEQEARRKRNQALDKLIRGHTLNRKDAEYPRYLTHFGRIRRVMCTAEQRELLNRGDIAVVCLRGSYLLVPLEISRSFAELAPELVPDLSGSEPEDDGSDYPPVPDDLVW